MLITFFTLWLTLVGLLPLHAEEWVTDTISYSDLEDRVVYNGLAIGPDNTYHLVFTRVYFDYGDLGKEIYFPGSDPFDVFYAYKEPGEPWAEPELIGETDRFDVNPSVVVCPEGQVSVAFMRYIDVDYWSEKIILAQKTGKGWEYQEVPTIYTEKNTVNWYPDLAVDPNGHLHLTWVSLEDGQFHEDDIEKINFRIAYSTNISGDWETQLLESSELGDFGLGASPEIEVCAEGVAHILYRGGYYGPDAPEDKKKALKEFRKYGIAKQAATGQKALPEMFLSERRDSGLNNYRMHYATNMVAGGSHWEIEELEGEKNYDEYGNILYDREKDVIHVLTGGSDCWELPNYVYYFSKEHPEGSWSDPVQVNQISWGNPLKLIQQEGQIFASYFGLIGQNSTGEVFLSKIVDGESHDRLFFSKEYTGPYNLVTDLNEEILFQYSKLRLLEEGDGEMNDRTLDIFINRSGEHYYEEPTTITSPAVHSKFSVFPNPAKSEVNILLKGEIYGNVRVEIFNIDGRQILPEQSLKTSKGIERLTLPVGNLPSGIYFIVLQSNEFRISEKLIVK